MAHNWAGLTDVSHELIQLSFDKEIFAKGNTLNMTLKPANRLMCSCENLIHGLHLDRFGNDFIDISEAVIARRPCLREPPFGHPFPDSTAEIQA